MIKGAGGDIFLPISIQSHTAQKARNRKIQTVSGFCVLWLAFSSRRALESPPLLTRKRAFFGERAGNN